MGCLNPGSGFGHWFANIHLSGPCNRACYFCVGQHMLALDAYDNLDTWPLAGLDEFLEACRAHDIREVNVTGTNTDPLLYQHTAAPRARLEVELPGLRLGIRTNGVLALARPEIMASYDKGSLTICSFEPAIYRAMMGRGSVPDLAAILAAYPRIAGRDWKLNVVLGPGNVGPGPTGRADVLVTLETARSLGIRRVNLREPYGQPHVGDPLAAAGLAACPDRRLGMPHYHLGAGDDIEVWYWDVHWVEVESVNLYASGRVSTLYPITAGHHPSGRVLPQAAFPGGRVAPQWRTRRGPAGGPLAD